MALETGGKKRAFVKIIPVGKRPVSSRSAPIPFAASKRALFSLQKEHQKLFIRVAIILSNMGQAEVKSSQNLHIKDEQG